MEDGELAQPCAVTFWTFAGPVIIGNLAMLAVGALADSYYKEEPHTTRKTAITFARYGAFWFAAGMAWIAFNRKNGAPK